MLHFPAHLAPSISELFEGKALFLSFLNPQHIVQSLMCGKHPVHEEVKVGKEKKGGRQTSQLCGISTLERGINGGLHVKLGI